MHRLATFEMTLFSVHMAQHMALPMLIPILLLLGAPITLALRVLPPQTGPAVLHSRVAKIVSHPGVTVPTFVASLFGLYFTDLLGTAARAARRFDRQAVRR